MGVYGHAGVRARHHFNPRSKMWFARGLAESIVPAMGTMLF